VTTDGDNHISALWEALTHRLDMTESTANAIKYYRQNNCLNVHKQFDVQQLVVDTTQASFDNQ